MVETELYVKHFLAYYLVFVHHLTFFVLQKSSELVFEASVALTVTDVLDLATENQSIQQDLLKWVQVEVEAKQKLIDDTE